MAQTEYSINSTAWTAITAAGESGTVYVTQKPTDSSDIVIFHNSTIPTTDDQLKAAYPVPTGKSAITNFTADDASDIYYARIRGNQAGTSPTARIVVDAS